MSEADEAAPNPAKDRRRRFGRIALIGLAVAAIGAGAWSIDFEPDLEHLDVAVVSGSEHGHYFAQVRRFAERADRDGGRVANLTTAGSGENLERLAAPGDDCEVDFGLVQDGGDFARFEGVEMVARLPRGETLFLLGRAAGAIEDFGDLRGMRIGVGPEQSGTAMLMDALFAQPGFDTLGVSRVNGAVSEQVHAAAAGELDLAAVVIFEDAAMIERAVRRGHLQIASLRSAAAVARHLGTGVRPGALAAGHYDAVRAIPDRERHVLRVDTLLLASECASRSEINAVLSVLGHELPGFVEHNRRAAAPHGLEMSSVATEYFENHGPPILDQYLPEVVDVVPLSNLATFVMALSVLFNVMGFLNRFQIWRVDTARGKLEGELRELFGGGITRKEIELFDPDDVLTTEAERAALADIARRTRGLIAQTRKQGGSMLVPMGGEMVYRYQEDLMLETLAVIRRFQHRMDEADA